MFAVFYAVIVEDDEEGIFVDSPYFGGVSHHKPQAEQLARHITNDRSMQGAIITKIYPFNLYEGLRQPHELATRQFNQMAKEMYDAEETQRRMRNRR